MTDINKHNFGKQHSVQLDGDSDLFTVCF